MGVRVQAVVGGGAANTGPAALLFADLQLPQLVRGGQGSLVGGDQVRRLPLGQLAQLGRLNLDLQGQQGREGWGSQSTCFTVHSTAESRCCAH